MKIALNKNTKLSNIKINFGISNDLFGKCIIAWCEDGLLCLHFTEDYSVDDILNMLNKDWPKAQFIRDDIKAKKLIRDVFNHQTKDLNAVVKATPFQLKVWQALLDITFGEIRTYADIANAINNEKAVRAVGTAIGQNPLAYLIPCHRVIRSDGRLGGYRWGLKRKQEILNYEQLSSVKLA